MALSRRDRTATARAFPAAGGRRRRGALRGLAGVAALAAGLSASGAAEAQFVVCNQSLDVVNVAIGRDAGDGFSTEGWWIVGANRCATTIRDELSARYVYVYADDVFGRAVLYGSTEMCVGAKSFRIVGTEACFQRGYRPAKFLEVDTEAVSRWTLFLSPRS
ncbi:DUF1036 domain-containing protein [Jiella avicenniae]|uniref:DUF1036 domain-containing protein n=1 Tax=Jiella avicenniae TaxID=2907202 RepID=A0A9X1P095_9HYPH|nr:DUF1036 domain-containing protein [Jiella avicenniae]MCE7027661.1 DUF1036 domain-containing protein [Jiella avicenniae]MCE7028703.1 DUF1036 domain-containing protein [Jiella avicenniae]